MQARIFVRTIIKKFILALVNIPITATYFEYFLYFCILRAHVTCLRARYTSTRKFEAPSVFFFIVEINIFTHASRK